jgi:hypothetical protein
VNERVSCLYCAAAPYATTGEYIDVLKQLCRETDILTLKIFTAYVSAVTVYPFFRDFNEMQTLFIMLCAFVIIAGKGMMPKRCTYCCNVHA